MQFVRRIRAGCNATDMRALSGRLSRAKPPGCASLSWPFGLRSFTPSTLRLPIHATFTFSNQHRQGRDS